MGKVKVKVLGDEQQEQEALEEQKKKREQKAAAKKVSGVGLGGGERINSVGVSEEEIMASMDDNKTEEASPVEAAEDKKEEKKAKKTVAREVSKRHKENESMIASKTNYPVQNAVEILKKFKTSKFDETVEVHLNVKEKGISGQVSLPHGTGKTLRIKIADDATIAEIEKGKIDFDVLIAQPAMMPKLARVARILGPRGLMPNPKAGTVTDNPDALIEKLSKGQVSYKTEAQAPLIHMSVGKLSFEDQKLVDNINTVISSVGANKIEKATLKSTMSPAVYIQL